MAQTFPIVLVVTADHAGKRLDQYLTSQIPDISRARVQHLVAEGKVLVNGKVEKTSLKLRGGEHIQVLGPPQLPPLRATAEDIPLDMVYEDDDVAVINKPAGMMVHAGAGATEHARNRGTLVNALLHRFGKLSSLGGELRPGIVHRLDRETSGLIVVAKNDEAHRTLARQFAERRARKTYIALVQGWPKQERATIRSPISRDLARRTRMTTRGHSGRDAVTHYAITRRLDTRFGKFALLEIKIETGRTHQIRVHMSSIGHPVVGDALYGAARELQERQGSRRLSLPRNFLHATALELTHPKTGETLRFSRPLPVELAEFLQMLQPD